MIGFKYRKHLLAAAATALGISALSATATAQQAISLGTSSVGSSFYAISVGMMKIIRKHGGLNVSVESLGGSHANMFGVARGKVDFAMGNSGATFDRYHGNAPFEKPHDIRLVAQGQPSFRGIFVRRDSGIKHPRDLVGKTILGKRKPLPELLKLVNAMIEVYGLPKDKIKIVSSRSLGEMNRILRTGSVPAAAYPFALRQPVITKLFNDSIVEPLIFAEDKYDAMKKILPGMFYKFRIKANQWKNQPKGFLTFGLTTQLVTDSKQDADVVYRVTKAILDNTKEFSKYHGSAKYWNTKRTLDNPSIPFHPGAIRYFKEVGAWNAKLAAKQAKLLKRM